MEDLDLEPAALLVKAELVESDDDSAQVDAYIMNTDDNDEEGLSLDGNLADIGVALCDVTQSGRKKSRSALSEEELMLVREKDRLRKRMLLVNETPEEAARRKERDRLRKRSGKQQEESWDKRERQRLLKRKYLSQETPEQTQLRRERDKLRKRKAAETQSLEEKQVRREKDRERKRRAKQLEHELEQRLLQEQDLEDSVAILYKLQQYERRREVNRLNKRRLLQAETPEQTALRRERDRLRKRRLRGVQNNGCASVQTTATQTPDNLALP